MRKLTAEIIDNIMRETTEAVKELMKDDLVEVILYGSCARGDYTEDSDVDIALLTKSNRIESQKYNDGLAAIATEFAMEYFALVNFICIPYGEFEEKKEWYPYFKNIEAERKIYVVPYFRADRLDFQI